MKIIYLCPKCNAELEPHKQGYYHNEYSCWFTCPNCYYKSDEIDCKNKDFYDIAKDLNIKIVKTYTIFEILQQLKKYKNYLFKIVKIDTDSSLLLLLKNDGIVTLNGEEYYFTFDDLKSEYWRILDKIEIFDEIKENDLIEVKCKILDTEISGKVIVEKVFSDNEFLVKDENENKFIISKNEIIRKK